MPQVPSSPSDLAQSVSVLARTLLATARIWTLYPPTHPAVREALDRLAQAIGDCTTGVECSIGVTPDTLLLKGEPLPPSQPVAEAAQFLHDRDILRLDLAQGVSVAALNDLVEILSLDTETRRVRGGPAAAWARTGHASISIEQIDYRRVLEHRDIAPDAVRRDDVWQTIVKSIVHGQMIFDEVAQQRLLEIARDPRLIGELARESMAPKCAVDGSPMIATQAATVVAAYRHMADIVSVMDPDHLAEVMRNLADATTTLDPHVMMQVLETQDDPHDATHVVRHVAGAFNDEQVARLLATTLAVEGQATARLADVFTTIAPDDVRRQRVLRMARDMLAETDFGRKSQFETLWTSMESLLLSYNEKPYVSDGYRTSLDGAGTRADTLAARDLPPELGEWLHTIDQDHVRQLSVMMMIDLLGLERTAEGAGTMATDLQILANDLLLAGDFANVARVTGALAGAAGAAAFVNPVACRQALDDLARSAALREAVTLLGDLDAAPFEAFCGVCADLGPEAVPALATTMTSEDESLRRRRAADLIVAYGTPALAHLGPLLADERWFVVLNGVLLIDRFAAPEAVPLLQPLLRRGDPRLTPRVVAALAGIDDPAAARAIHTVLRSVTGALRRAVIASLVQERDQRVVPILERILRESEPFGRDHPIVLETMAALATLDADRAVPPIAAIIRRTRWFARRRRRALKRTGVQLLLKVGSPAARRVLDQARLDGDRLLRRIVRDTQGSAGVTS
jgi:HEAT repeat protein